MDVEAMFEIQGVVNEFPICCHSSGNPGLAAVIVHGGEGFSDNWIPFRGGGDFLGEGGVNGSDVKVLICSLQEGDLPVVIPCLNLVLSREVLAGPILIPHSTPHLMSYSCRNSHHLACQQLRFWGCLKYPKFLWSIITVTGCSVPVRCYGTMGPLSISLVT